ncbi:MAG: putative sporulation protein YtxC [Bacillota bacterium]|jgi:putative sporulation protein YtxC
MVTLISISTSMDADFICSRLGKELSILQNEGINVLVEQNNKGNFVFLDCSIEEAKKPEQEMILRHYVANAISDAILGQWEYLLLKKITKNHYYYLSPDEKENVLMKAKKILDAMSNNEEDKYLMYRLNRKSKILHKVLDYLSQNNSINIDGFINFRLQDYLEDLNHVIEQAVDELLLEKEYEEFIMLLKYFVDIQEPRLNKVHVMLLSSGNFQLFDDHDKSINEQCLEGCIVEMIDNEINYEDLLISALITIAPREIVVHVPEHTKSPNIIKTLQGVFGERLEICIGCTRCVKKNRNTH